jgi:hypothetical protein
MDLERTISNGLPAFWKGNRYGYTYKIEFAGMFSHEQAQQIVSHDLDNTTVMIHVDTVHRILGKDLKQHEGSA